MSLVQQRRDALRSAEDIIDTAKAAGRDLTADEVNQINHLIKAIDDLDVKITAAEAGQALLDRIGALPPGTVTPTPGSGHPFTASATGLYQAPSITPTDEQTKEMWQALVSRKSLRLSIGGKTEPWSVAQPAFRVSPPLGYPREPSRVLDFVPVTPTSAPIVEYLRVDSVTGVAAVVAAGQPKPELALSTSTPSLTIPKIAALIRVVDETLSDYLNFRQFVATELQRAVIDAENNVLLNAASTGLNVVAGVIERDQLTDSLLDCMEQALNDLRVGAAYVSADLVVANPSDFSAMRRSKDLQDRYLLNADPSAAEANSLWGVPVLQTTQQPEGTVLVMNAAVACQGWVREGLRIDSLSSGSDWEANVTAVRAEERVGLAVTRPAGICRVTLAEES